jgi:intracellular sulfur oxidation DsrE/DsrF family protein
MVSRHGFLIASAAAVALSGKSALAASPTPVPGFDLSAFDALLAREARHRQCFGATERRGGAVLYEMRNSIRAYTDALLEPAGSMHAIAVFYAGNSIGLAYDDDLWNELLIPAITPKTGTGEAKPGSGNPYESLLDELSSAGSDFLVCNNALHEDAAIWARVTKRTPDEMYEYIAGHLIPSATIVPAGVMAINAAQEARFTYIAV